MYPGTLCIRCGDYVATYCEDVGKYRVCGLVQVNVAPGNIYVHQCRRTFDGAVIHIHGIMVHCCVTVVQIHGTMLHKTAASGERIVI